MISVLTDHPVATHSPDHIHAKNGGSGNDNSYNPNFNRKLIEMFGRVSLLDLGCAGGGFVKTLLDDGHFAVGLEGSDYSFLRKRAEWATIPECLFTCDITKPYRILTDGETNRIFDIVTAWEVMEHLSEAELPQTVTNVLTHLVWDGVWIMSVSQQADRSFHRCLHDREWWVKQFAAFGLVHDEKVYNHFNPDWVRGPMQTPWAINAPDSFHLCLRNHHVE